jgi:Ca2+-binding RTX toxin-like protein
MHHDFPDTLEGGSGADALLGMGGGDELFGRRARTRSPDCSWVFRGGPGYDADGPWSTEEAER